MEPNTAEDGLYRVSIISIGTSDEERTDALHFTLWAQI